MMGHMRQQSLAEENESVRNSDKEHWNEIHTCSGSSTKSPSSEFNTLQISLSRCDSNSGISSKARMSSIIRFNAPSTIDPKAG